MSGITNITNITWGSKENPLMTSSGIFYIMAKILRVLISYVALTITTNYYTQVYMNKVLVNGENPPHLTNFVYLFLFIDAIIFLILMVMMYAVTASDIISVELDSGVFGNKIIPDYIVYMLVTASTCSIIANKMYEKKYFLYKDDGMRAIRALKELTFSVAIMNTMLPWNYLVQGMINSVNT